MQFHIGRIYAKHLHDYDNAKNAFQLVLDKYRDSQIANHPYLDKMRGDAANFTEPQTNGLILSAPITVDVIGIKFDYDHSSHTNDAVDIRVNNSTNIPVPEWANAGQTNAKIAYIKNKSNRKIKAKFYCDKTGTYGIKAMVLDGTGIGDLPETNVYFNSSHQSSYITFTANGSTPSSVGIRRFRWNWFVIYATEEEKRGVKTLQTLWVEMTGHHNYYTLLTSPQNPMSEPWTDALDYSCDWASGQSNSPGATTKIAQKLFNNCGFLYDTYSGAPRYTNYGSGSFNLTLFLSEIGSGRVVNCYDMGKTVKIFANSISCNTNYKFCNPFGYLNCVKPIGRGWSNNPFYSSQSPPYNQPIVGEDDSGRTKFGNHAFGAHGCDIYDACLKVDTDENPDYGPPFDETWATGWYWNTYKSKVIDDNPSSSTGNPSIYSFSVY